MSEGRISMIRNYKITSSFDLALNKLDGFDFSVPNHLTMKNKKILTLFYESNNIGLYYTLTTIPTIKRSIHETFGPILKDVSIIEMTDVTSIELWDPLKTI